MPTQQPSRQQRRQQERRLAELGRKAMAQGFPPDLGDEVSLGVALVIRDKLRETRNALRAGEAAGIAEQVLERSNVGYEADPGVDCRRGCAFCCKTAVSVTPPEVFRITAHLRKARAVPAESSVAAIAARCRPKLGVGIEALLKSRLPCPLLVADECSVHPVRPLNCRQLLSTSVDACRAEHAGEKRDIPFVPDAINRGLLARIVLLGAVKASGLADTSYELAGALAIALAQPDAEPRWLAGEDVFAGALVTPRPSSTQEFVDRVAGFLAAPRP